MTDIHIGEENIGILPKEKQDKQICNINGDVITEDNVKNIIENNLIQRAIDKDEAAFNELYTRSYRYTFFVIRQYIADDETTYDAIQETFIKVYKNISGLREPAAYYGWLTSVAKNTAIDILRTKPAEAELVYEEKNDNVIRNEQINKDVSLDIETVLKKMDPAEADLLSLVYYDGMRISQIAKMQGVPKTTVYSRFNKAKKNLKAQLAVYGIDKAVYSGNFVAMITTAIRNIIGTALLSFAVSQQILDSITGKKTKKELAVAKILFAQQKKSVLKIASCLIAICIFVSCFTILVLTDWGRKFKLTGNNEKIIEYHYYNSSSNSENHSDKDNGVFLQSMFENDSVPSENDTPLYGNSSTTGLLDNSLGDSDKNSTHEDVVINSMPDDTDNNISINTSSDESVSSTFISPTTPDDFVPDCNSSQYNTVGNLAHNITLHFGKVAKQGDFIYYAAESDKHWLITNLYKVKTDGTQKQLLVENICISPFINVVGEWIYFVAGHALSEYHLARVRTDGTGYQKLTDFKIEALQVVGNTAYFYRSSSGGYSDYCKMNLKTGEIDVLIKNTKDLFACVTDKYFLYRPDGIQGNLCIYDNKTGELVHNFESRGMQVYNNKVLVDDADGVTLYNLDNLSEKPVKLSKYISSLFDSGTYLFYSPYKGGVICDRKKTSDGNGEVGVLTLSNFEFKPWPFEWAYTDADDFTNYSTFDDEYVYCIVNKNLYRCYPDGTNLTVY